MRIKQGSVIDQFDYSRGFPGSEVGDKVGKINRDQVRESFTWLAKNCRERRPDLEGKMLMAKAVF